MVVAAFTAHLDLSYLMASVCLLPRQTRSRSPGLVRLLQNISENIFIFCVMLIWSGGSQVRDACVLKYLQSIVGQLLQFTHSHFFLTGHKPYKGIWVMTGS